MTPPLARCLGAAMIALALALSSCGDNGSAEVRAVYDEYNAALQRRDGDAFLKVIDPENVKHYDQFVRAAQRGTSIQISRFSLVDRSYILIMRHRLAPDELAKLDGASFVKLCIERDWFFKEDEDEKFSLGRIIMNPPRASADLRINGQSTNNRLDFVQVDGHWLVNDEAFDRAFERRLSKAATRLGMAEDRLLIRLEENFTGDAVDPKIFETPGIADSRPAPDPVTITRDPAGTKKPAKKR